VDVLLTRKGGRPSGEAFVVLGTPYQVQLQLARGVRMLLIPSLSSYILLHPQSVLLE
jgi:hypothetical protein